LALDDAGRDWEKEKKQVPLEKKEKK